MIQMEQSQSENRKTILFKEQLPIKLGVVYFMFLVLVFLTLVTGLNTTEEAHGIGKIHDNSHSGVHYEDGELMLYAITFS